MTLKESLKDRYGNGKRNGSLWHIAEVLLIAGIVAVSGILYDRFEAIPVIFLELTSMGKRLDAQAERLKRLEDCITRHLEESIHRK